MGSLLLPRWARRSQRLRCTSSCSALGWHLLLPQLEQAPPWRDALSVPVGRSRRHVVGAICHLWVSAETVSSVKRPSLPRGLDEAPLLCAPSMPLTSPLCNAHQATGNCNDLFQVCVALATLWVLRKYLLNEFPGRYYSLENRVLLAYNGVVGICPPSPDNTLHLPSYGPYPYACSSLSEA